MRPHISQVCLQNRGMGRSLPWTLLVSLGVTCFHWLSPVLTWYLLVSLISFAFTWFHLVSLTWFGLVSPISFDFIWIHRVYDSLA